ncbi:DNA polymerase delta, subunit 4-domain-containing protein [Multifurca ochricompacta]|uniref:DNA polymerase delta, subunit 4-domain-containing protein n=1 Tax=Multifurca ochricompacta TaxID=376703 RepID=A0AAD4M1S2_9AGAM|nr:DNA polymerase delta, subunit 4-domain-containing protein [Multifurca ochricompacta]
MAPQRSSSVRAQEPKSSGSLRQGILSFTSVKRSGSSIAKDSVKGKASTRPAEPIAVTSIRVGGKRKYEPDLEPELENERGEETTEVAERERLDLGDPRWNKAFGWAREKMGDIQPVHAEGQSPVHHILRVFDLSYEYGPCIGVTRLERWERAEALGLDPPAEVREILVTKEGHEDQRLIQNVLYEEV